MDINNAPARLALDRLDRELAARSEEFASDMEFDDLSRRMRRLRERLFRDQEVDGAELDTLYAELEATAQRWSELAGARGIPVSGDIEVSRRSFRTYAEGAEIHFEYLAGDNRRGYQGGLLAEWIHSSQPAPVARKIALDLVTSATPAIACAKAQLIKAQVSLAEGERRKALLDQMEAAVDEAASGAAWAQTGRSPALTREDFAKATAFSSVVAVARTRLPEEVRETNEMFPNHPLPGWREEVRGAVRSLLDTLSRRGILFLDRLSPSPDPCHVAVKLDLNLGFAGPPSVSDPATTGAVIAELLARARPRGVRLILTVGDSCGIENAPVGRNALDIMRETGNYHHALKAVLEHIEEHDNDSGRRAEARRHLALLRELENGSKPAYLGSPADSRSTAADLESIERLAAVCLRCVDFDEEGFVPRKPNLGPLGLAVWGTSEFHLARPWADAAWRVHLTRGVSTHLFAGWTGALKGLIGLHALGLRPADQGMNQRGESPLDVLLGVMHMGGAWGGMARRSGVHAVRELMGEGGPVRQSRERAAACWEGLRQQKEFHRGWVIWEKGALELEKQLRRGLREGVTEVEVMARMRVRSRELLAEAESASPGFRAALWNAVHEGTRDFLVNTWKVRQLLPREMRDERMGLRIGLLAQLPFRSDLVVESLPKIGIGGGPDAYDEVRDAGIIAAGTDEASVDLVALERAGVPGNPWAYHFPVHGALQFGAGPARWEEIDIIEAGDGAA